MKHYSDETVSQCISMLLLKLDLTYGEGMHWRGQTPDWYVCAAMVSSDTEDPNGDAAKFITEEAERYEALHSNS
jgi:hypothetical protein